MVELSLEQIKELERVASEHDGKCDRCHQTLKIYRHKPNAQHARILRRMAKVVKANLDAGLPMSEANIVNFNDIEGEFSQKSQRSKMRQHGLIAKYKEDAKHVRNTWLITKKGWEFLGGSPIPETVVVYDNQVIGHEGGTVTIHRLLDEPGVYEEQKISSEEAQLYGDARKPKRHQKMRAVFIGHYHTGLTTGQEYDLEIEHLQVGKPVKVVEPIVVEYLDMAAFARNWKVIKGE